MGPGGSWQLGADLRDTLPNPRDLQLVHGRGLVNYGNRLELYDFPAKRTLRSYQAPPGEVLLRVLPAPDGATCYVWTLRGAVYRYRLTD